MVICFLPSTGRTYLTEQAEMAERYGGFGFTRDKLRAVEEIYNKVTKQSGRNTISLLFHAKNDKETIVAWKSGLSSILVVFNVCSVCSCSAVANCPFLRPSWP